MVTNDEKKDLLQEIVETSWKNGISIELKKKLHKLLLKDTKDGKLYKYRTFDKDGYSLENLRGGTLYCANVATFNDPFEGYMGASMKELLIEVHGKYITIFS